MAIDVDKLQEGVIESSLEEEASGQIDSEEPDLNEDLDSEAQELEQPPARLAFVVSCSVLASAVMVGGVFEGAAGRVYAGIAGIAGIVLAYALRNSKRPLITNLAIFVGLFAIGLLLTAPFGLNNLPELRAHVLKAAASGDVLRPPVPFNPGWAAILGWLMGTAGFLAAWTAIVIRRPSIGLLLPLPVAAVAAVSIPKDAQIPSGIGALVLFAVGLGLLSSTQTRGETGEKSSLAFEARRAMRSIPMIAGITVILYLLAQSQLLFPKPIFDPTQEPQKPKTVPLSEVQDRVLFEVESSISGPWRIGVLDVYDGKDWRLPPFAQNKLKEVSRSGVVDKDLVQGIKARFTVAGLGGAVLPGIPSIVSVVAEGPALSYDSRNGNIRVTQGQVTAGLRYAVTAATLPSVEQLRAITNDVPKSVKSFLEIPPPPSAVVDLLSKAPKTSKWDAFDYLRTFLLDNVVATGAGVPKSVTPDTVQDLIAGSKEGSPFEIVAAQAMMARWAGVPSRIAYGFDGGDLIDGRLQVRPRNGVTFVEVFFPGYKWLPVIGTPKQAKASLGNDQEQLNDPNVLPSEDIAVQLSLPVVVAPDSIFLKQVRTGALVAIVFLLLAFLVYLSYPLVQKGLVRSRRRSSALEMGIRGRIALAYGEWRDIASDFGFSHPSETPLMFRKRFLEDEEHTQLAWLATRGLWGDLQNDLTPEHATAAEELSRALRRRLAQVQPPASRLVAKFSRISLRSPFAAGIDLYRSRKNAPAAAPSRTRRRVYLLGALSGTAAVCTILVALAVIAVPLGAPSAGVRSFQSEIAFGVKPPVAAAPTQSAPIFIPQPADDFSFFPNPFPRPAPVPIVDNSICPAAALNEFPDKEAGVNVEQKPTLGIYRWQRSGSQTIGGKTTVFSGFERRAVRRVTDIANAVYDPASTQPKMSYSFEVVRVFDNGTKEIRGFRVNTAAVTQDPERGLSLVKIENVAANGTVDPVFTPAQGQGLLLFPLPVTAGGAFSGSSVDPTNGIRAEITGQVVRREQVDACGDLMAGWSTNTTLTFTGLESANYKYNFVVAPQYGAFIIMESLDGSVTGGTEKSQFTLGQVDPSPLTSDLK